MRHSLLLAAGLAALLIPVVELTAQQADQGQDNGDKAGIPIKKGKTEYTPKPMFSDEWFDQTKQPVDWFKWGADQRLRTIWDKNLTTVDEGAGNERFWQRYRTRLWGTITPFEDLDINLGLAWEWRNYCRPKGPRRDTDMDEVVFETVNVSWKKAFGLPLTITVGRQNILGINKNRWLIFEGTPLDGSRTIYMDAARFTYEMEEAKTTIDAIYIDNSHESDRWLVPINDRDKQVIEHDERGGILYVSNKSLPNTSIDGYFIVKHDMGSELFPTSDRTTYTLGARVAGFLDEPKQWEYDVQYAQQWGHEEGQGNICAGGALAKLSYSFQDDWKSKLRWGYEYRSGDDPSTGHKESFDVLWGRYPQWSNIYEGYLDTFEGTRPAYAANLHRIRMGYVFSPCGREDMSIATDYHLLLTDQNTYGAAGNLKSGVRTVSKSGCVRGHLVTALWKWDINKHISTHLIGEVLFPGDYYTDAKNEPVFFTRYELVFKW